MKTVYLDTNVLLRFFLKDIPKQYLEEKKIIEQAKRREIQVVVCQAVVFETEFALDKFYKFRKKDIFKALATIVTMPYFKVEDVDVFQEALLMYSDKNVDLVDCFIYCKASLDGGEVLSFDNDFKKIAKK